MARFEILLATAAPLEQRDINTDQVIPGRFLRRRREEGLADCLFHDLRFHPDGTERADFMLNQPAFREAKILIANENFGCGSSREFAVFALHDHGIRCIIAPSFGDIFQNNCFRSGLLPVVLSSGEVADLRAQATASPGTRLLVDLPRQLVIGADGAARRFEVDPFRKRLLLNGVDEIGFTLGFQARIAAFEAARETMGGQRT